MTRDEALDIIAARAAHEAIENVVPYNWDGFPEVGESAWEVVVERACRLVDDPTEGEIDEAYALLATEAAADAAAENTSDLDRMSQP